MRCTLAPSWGPRVNVGGAQFKGQWHKGQRAGPNAKGSKGPESRCSNLKTSGGGERGHGRRRVRAERLWLERPDATTGGREARFSRAHAPSPGMVFFLELLFLFKRSLNVLSSLSSRHR